MSDISKSTESRSKKTRSKWNPFHKIVSIVTGKNQQSTESSNSSEGDSPAIRWTTACLNTTCPIFSRSPQFNMIYSPAPSLMMYVVVTLASEHAMTQTLQRLFGLTDKDMEEIREMSQKLSELGAPHQFYCFIRFLVDEQQTTTVSRELMIRSNDVATQQVFSSIRPSRVIKFLNTLTFHPVSVSRPALFTTNGYASAGLNATWHGEAKKAGLNRFACTFHRKKFEEFFEIRTTYRRVLMDHFEVIELPFTFGPSSTNFGSLLILRPHFIGNLPYSNRQLTTGALSKMLDTLYSSDWILDGHLLIPQFSASSCQDLWKNLMRHGVQPDLGQSQKAPPMASLWHWASLKVGSSGISANVKKNGEKSQTTLHKTFHDRISTDSLLEKHKSYSGRIDSPFSYIVMVHGIPIFTGSYFGSPPPKSSQVFINAPERIRHRRTIITKKRRNTKITRKQRLLRKVRKSEEKEKEKDRKRAKKALIKNSNLKKKRKSNSSSSSNGTTETSSTKSSSTSTKVVDVPKEKVIEKSKSSGWRRLANRIFRRKR